MTESTTTAVTNGSSEATKDSAGLDGRKMRARSRITNGTALLPSVDGRSMWARLMRDTYGAVLAHCGGEDQVSELEKLAARRISALEAELIHLEDKFATLRTTGRAPQAADLDLYSRLSNTQRRLAESLGWQRRSRDVTPSLEAYLAAKGNSQNE